MADNIVTQTIEDAKAIARETFPDLTTEETAWLTIAGYNIAVSEVVPEPFVPLFLGTAGDHMKALHERYEAERAGS